MNKVSYNMVMAFAVIALSTASLSGCSNPKKALGLNRSVPDEFTVVSKAPLVLPPEYNLTPANESSITAVAETPSQKAESIVFSLDRKAQVKPVDVKDKSTNKLLAMAGATQDNSGIRATIDKETLGLIEDNKGLGDMLLFWNDTVYDPTADTVNAKQEKQRLQSNKKEGKPVTAGETPVVKAKQKTLFNN